MHKLYFKYGTMGSSKTAQALMCRFNYIQKGFNVLLLKPSIDTRDVNVKSRIGLEAPCIAITPNQTISSVFDKTKHNVIIIDESQFLTKKQVEEVKELTEYVPVLCFGLLTNFKTELFEGSKRLIELSDSITEIKSVCKCGRKSILNGRIIDGKLVTEGPEICIGADESYVNLCYNCFKHYNDKK